MRATESRAVAIARAHREAWSKHDYDEARRHLAQDVKVTATTTVEGAPNTDLTGADEYMKGLIIFADTVKPGSLVVNETVGDDRNALLMVTDNTEGPPFWVHDPSGSPAVPSRRERDDQEGAGDLLSGAGLRSRRGRAAPRRSPDYVVAKDT